MSKILNKAQLEKGKLAKLKYKTATRITTVRFGKESQDTGDHHNAIRKWIDYLVTMSELKKVTGIYDLRVNHFNPKDDLTEMLMISHIYFELAKMYDSAPRFHEESRKCLEQFVHFSSNQPYQVVNSELIRKHLKKTNIKNPDAFRYAYQQIFVQSKKCFVVTFCFGNEHPITNRYRLLKDVLLEYSLGQKIVEIYYRYSSLIINKWGHSLWFILSGKTIFSPLLVLFSNTLLRVILRK